MHLLHNKEKEKRGTHTWGVLGLPLLVYISLPSLSRVTISFPSLSRTMSLSSVAKANAATPLDPGGPGEAAGPGDFPPP